MLDFHSKNLFRLVRMAVDRFKPLKTQEIPAPYREASADLDTIRVDFIGDGVDVLKADDDTPVRPWFLRLYILLNNHLASHRDMPETWGSAAEGLEKAKTTFGKYIPEPDVEWGGVKDLTAVWARQGLGAHRLTRVGENHEEEVFAATFEHMSEYAVRDGIDRYGGDAYLGADGSLRRIRLHGEDVRPGDPGWEHAQFAFRTSSLVWTTLADHVLLGHFVLANAFLISTKRFLKLDHPLRSFCAPFHYRTGAINNGGVGTLVPKGGMFHRTTAFTWPALLDVYNAGVAEYRFETFPDQLRRKGVHPDSIEDAELVYPYGADGVQYWDCVAAFVQDVFDTSPAMQEVLGSRREETAQWWEAQSQLLPGGLPQLGQQSLQDYLAHVIFTVTGFHQHVGSVAAYVLDPSLCSGKTYAEATICDVQSSGQLGVVACITGLSMPMLQGNFSHLMPDAGAKEAEGRFRESLAALQVQIDARNERRQLAHNTFSPRALASSISI